MRYIFDVDGTLLESGAAQVGCRMRDALIALSCAATVVLISGARVERVLKKIPSARERMDVYILGQSGSDAVRFSSLHTAPTLLWTWQLSEAQREAVLAHARALPELFPFFDERREDLVDDRGAQISLSLVGHDADFEVKRRADPDMRKRALMLAQYPLCHRELVVTISGAATLDYTLAAWDKGGNIRALLQREGWDADDCIFVGDRLHPGGNDESVAHVIPHTLPVRGPEDTLAFIEAAL